MHFEVLEAPLTMPGRWATAGGCPERAWQRERGREATGLAGSGEGVTSAEGHAAAARSRAREGNENQLKAGLLFRGQKGDFQWQKLGKVFFFSFSQERPPPHWPSLSGGGRARAGVGREGQPLGHSGGALCLLLPCPPLVAELLSPQLLPLCRCGKGRGQRGLRASPPLKHQRHMRPHWSQELCEAGAWGDEATEAQRGDMNC